MMHALLERLARHRRHRRLRAAVRFLDKRLLADAGLDGLIDGSPFPLGFAGAFGSVARAWSDPEPVESAPDDSHMKDNEIRAVCRRSIAAGNGGTARNPVCQP